MNEAERIKELEAEVELLQGIIDNLYEQHERQNDQEACALWQSYPTKFPDWEQAWEQARKVQYRTRRNGKWEPVLS